MINPARLSLNLLACISLLPGITVAAAAESGAGDVVLDALSGEIDRAMKALANNDAAPYFISAEMTDSQSVRITGEAGGLHGYSPHHQRWLDIDLRIGGRKLDSSHALRNTTERRRSSGRRMPLADDADLIRRAAWLEIDRRYQTARERWAKVEAETTVLVEEEPAEDLAEVAPARSIDKPATLAFEPRRWEEVVKAASKVFAENELLLEGTVTFAGDVETHWFVSSEGTRVRHGGSRYRLDMTAQSVAWDGEVLRMHEAYDSHDADGLPDHDTILAGARLLVSRLLELRTAPDEEPYTGPAILSDRAAAVFFHEILGHRIEGHRLKQINNAQTFRNRVGQAILPPFLTVYDDPTLESSAGTDLRGHYAFDNQGVPAERVLLVENGTLRRFLQSRSPVARRDRPNGHGRRATGADAVSRQGNLLVVASESVSNEELRAGLIELAKTNGQRYALYIDDIQGGFTLTERTIPNAFNINALRSYRVYVDGRPDELVRGIDLIGTPLEAFGKIRRAGELRRVFNGTCGAESGWVPVSALAPALLLESVETQRKRKDQVIPPILPAPVPGGAEPALGTAE